jgi:hypothetical protein
MKREQMTCRCELDYQTAINLFYFDKNGVLFNKITRGSKSLKDKPVGNLNTTGALQVKVNSKCYLVHRVIWLLTYGEFPKFDIDHINGIRTDNRIENLRECKSFENAQNRVVHSNNKEKLQGVWLHKKGIWRAEIMVKGKRIHLGLHKSPELAHKAYLEAKIKHHSFNPKPRKQQETCRCKAYAWPHRLDSKACRELYNATQADQETSASFNPYVDYAISGLFAPDNSVPLRNPL